MKAQLIRKSEKWIKLLFIFCSVTLLYPTLGCRAPTSLQGSASHHRHVIPMMHRKAVPYIVEALFNIYIYMDKVKDIFEYIN